MRISLAAAPRRAVAGVGAVLAATILLGAGPQTARVTPATLDLGAAARFAILAGGGISDTGPSVIAGDVGTHPLPAIPDLIDKETTGTVDRAGSKSQLAQHDLATALATVAALTPDGTVGLAADRTLTPGVYAVASDKGGFPSSLTLDGRNASQPVWIFIVAQDLVTMPGSTVTLINGADPCNVFWSVGGSAKLASGSAFAGSVLATTSVSVGHDVTIVGRLLARTAAVSLGGDTITVPVCSTARVAVAAVQPSAAGAFLPSSTPPAASTRAPSTIPGYLPVLMLVMAVAAAVLGQPRRRHRHRPPDQRGW